MLLNKESKRETPSVVAFSSKQRMMGTDAGGVGRGGVGKAGFCGSVFDTLLGA